MADKKSVDMLGKALEILNEGGGDITEEKIEQAFDKVDLNNLFSVNKASKNIARIVQGVPEDVRLTVLSMLAAYINSNEHINPALKFFLVALLRALPQGITTMLGKVDLTADDLEQKIEEIKESVTGRRAYVGPKRTDLIHDPALHPLDDYKGMNVGGWIDILQRFDRNQLCPDCFREEMGKDRIVVMVESAPPPPPKAPIGPLETIANFPEHKRDFFLAVEEYLKREVNEDLGLGQEGEANLAQVATAEAVRLDPRGLEAMIPDAPDDVKIILELNQLSPQEISNRKKPGVALLPQSARLYIRSVLAAYRVRHPISSVEARAKDWGDSLLSWVPSSVKSKKTGWRGVYETFTSPLGLLFLGFVIFMVTLGAVTIRVAHVIAIRPFIGMVWPGVLAIYAMFDEHTNPMMMDIQRSVTVVWLSLVILPIAGHFSARFEALRPRILTMRVIATAVGLGATLIGWGIGWFDTSGVAFMTSAIWLIILVAEFTNKFTAIISAEYKSKSTERFVTYGGAIGVALLVLGIVTLGMVGHDDRERLTVLANGIANHAEDVLAAQAGVELPPTSVECQKGLASFTADAAAMGSDVQKLCASNSEMFPCTCL